MISGSLRFFDRPPMRGARMVIGLTGWMDGGDVSTGTIGYLKQSLAMRKLAEIDPAEYYIYGVPGPMELVSMFRPHTRIEDGCILDYKEPVNAFYGDLKNRLVLFEGKEPNLKWDAFAECIFEVADACDVGQMVFAGSVSGVVPHTRDARIHGSVSDGKHGGLLAEHDVFPVNYEGPASFVTHLMVRCKQRGIPMSTLVAEVPAYVQGKNPICIETMTRRVASMLDLPVTLSEFAQISHAFKEKLDHVVEEREDLAALVEKMEADYDAESSSDETDELRQWFESQNIRLD